MTKKKEKKALAVMRSEVLLKKSGTPFQVRESYRLIRIRLLNVHDFIEITPRDGKKKTFSKSVIKAVGSII